MKRTSKGLCLMPMLTMLMALLVCLACQPQPEPSAQRVAPAPPVMEVATTGADGLPMVYDVRGTGDTTLVFVHCWACDRSFWRGQLDHFAATYRVVSIDLPGHGSSSSERERWTVPDLGADVVSVIDELQLGRIVLIGHSMGGPVSLFAAAQRPEKVIGIVVADTLHDVEQERPVEQMEQIAVSFEQDFAGTMARMAQGAFAAEADPELVAWVTEKASSANPQVAIALFRSFADLDLAQALAAVKVPVRAINKAPQSERDPVTKVETNRKYCDFDAVIMDGVGHFLILERPQEFNARLEEVLAEITAPR